MYAFNCNISIMFDGNAGGERKATFSGLLIRSQNF